MATRYVVAERKASNPDPPGYTQMIGTPPYEFTIHDIVKGVIFGCLGYAFPKLLGVKMTPVKAAVTGAFSGFVGGLEDILDAFAYAGLPGAHDAVHELFQSGLMNIGVSTAVSALLSLLFK